MKVLLIVGGGIAAYKAPNLVRSFVKAGHEVQVVTTRAALAFTTEMSLSVVSGRAVRTELLDASAEGSVGHIELADWPDVVVVAPATANIMARAAAGLADDLATTVLLATQAPVLYAPAMNTNMWRHPATVHNLAVLSNYGAQFVGPDAGDLACGWVGEGRMIDEAPIVEAAQAVADGEVVPTVEAGSAASDDTPAAPVTPAIGPWTGRNVVVSAGPTRSYLDPVRFLTNASTGAMGFAVAEVAARLGADVTLVAGPVDQPTPAGVTRIDVETAHEMMQALDGHLEAGDCDLVAMVAAVSDLKPANAADDKIEKAQLAEVMSRLEWGSETDILATLVDRYADTPTRFLGFGAQTVEGEVGVEERLVELGRKKLERKGCDALFVNRVGVRGRGFASVTNAGHLLLERPDEGFVALNSGRPIPKVELAEWILTRLHRYFWEHE